MLLIATRVHKLKKKLITESTVAILVGIIVAACGKYGCPHFYNDCNPEGIVIPGIKDIFYYGLLPPIIFEAGYSMKKRLFLKNIGAILNFAVFGTIISTVVIGFILYWGGQGNLMGTALNTHEGPFQCFLYAALISAVDPVATLGEFSFSHTCFILNYPSLLFDMRFICEGADPVK
jgi:sodium/hydrogen exchanger 8